MKEFPWISKHVEPGGIVCVHVVRADSTLLPYGPIVRSVITGPFLSEREDFVDEEIFLLDKDGDTIGRHYKKKEKRWPWSRQTTEVSYMERSVVRKRSTVEEVIERFGRDAEKIHYVLSHLLGSVIVYRPRGGKNLLGAIREEERAAHEDLKKEIEEIDSSEGKAA